MVIINLNEVKKSYLDLVSEVDKNSEKKIVSWIEENFPEHSSLADKIYEETEQAH